MTRPAQMTWNAIVSFLHRFFERDPSFESSREVVYRSLELAARHLFR